MSVDRARLERHIAELSAIGGTGTSVTRLGLSPEEQRARDLVGGWLRARGATVRRDAAANIYGRFGGPGPAILVGSHIDSVPEGGRFDGALGVLCAVEAVEALLDDGARFKRPVEVVGWCDEEGARFGIGLFGSCAAFGRLPDGAAQRADPSGVTIADALRAIGEAGDPTAAKRASGDIAAYLELHIEQGPRLEAEGLDLGVVDAIVGIDRYDVVVHGQANHAGTTPFNYRHDAGRAAARFIGGLRELVQGVDERMVANVGALQLDPGAPNVVPGGARFVVEVRCPDPAALEAVRRVLSDELERKARDEGCTVDFAPQTSWPAMAMFPGYVAALDRVAERSGLPWRRLASGAGHDAEILARHVPAAMLFVPSHEGISHSPLEHTDERLLAQGCQALLDSALEILA